MEETLDDDPEDDELDVVEPEDNAMDIVWIERALLSNRC